VSFYKDDVSPFFLRCSHILRVMEKSTVQLCRVRPGGMWNTVAVFAGDDVVAVWGWDKVAVLGGMGDTVAVFAGDDVVAV
jgi:hypothetical protein